MIEVCVRGNLELKKTLKFPKIFPFRYYICKREIRGFALFCRSPDALAKGVIHPCQTQTYHRNHVSINLKDNRNPENEFDIVVCAYGGIFASVAFFSRHFSLTAKRDFFRFKQFITLGSIPTKSLLWRSSETS